MDRKRFWLTMVLTVMVAFACAPVQAQPGPKGKGNDKRLSPQEKMEMREKKGKHDPTPEMMEMRKKLNSIQAIAEAHKELAKIYEEQKKSDEAAAELRKIIDLIETVKIDMPENKNKGMILSRKILPVYFEISRLYLSNNRVDDAEKILLEGIARFEKDEPHSASKLTLALSDLYKKNNKLDKATELLKKVIEINQKELK